ncbi:sodium:proton antiporter [Elusimicrobiota bacterium]
MSSIPLAYGLCIFLFFIGLYGVITKKNVVKIIISIIIMENALNLFLLLIGFRKGGIAPILKSGMDVEKFANTAVDPLPQAMVLTAIVIGFSVAALMVAVAIRLYQRFNTFDITEIKDLKG